MLSSLIFINETFFEVNLELYYKVVLKCQEAVFIFMFNWTTVKYYSMSSFWSDLKPNNLLSRHSKQCKKESSIASDANGFTLLCLQKMRPI